MAKGTPVETENPSQALANQDKRVSDVSTLTAEETADRAAEIAKETADKANAEASKEKAKPKASTPAGASADSRAKRQKGELPPTRYVTTPLAFASIAGEGLVPLDSCAAKLGVATGAQVADMLRVMWGTGNGAKSSYVFDTPELVEKAKTLRVTSLLLGNAAMVRRLLGDEKMPADGIFSVEKPHERLDSVRGALGQAMLDAGTLANMCELREHSNRAQVSTDPATHLERFVLRSSAEDTFLTAEETSRRIGALAALGRIMDAMATGKTVDEADRATVRQASGI